MNQASLDALIDLATEKRDAAATELGRLQGQHSRAQDQLDALLTYRAEYGGRLAEAMAKGMSMNRLDNDQRFLAALDEAIEQQSRLVDDSQNRLHHGQHDWRERQRRLKSFDALSARRAEAQAKRDTRREQQQNDEAAGRSQRRASR
ncbi:flagellar export protein FliJ [Salinisphaera sp. SPP-AMP-43]|uniref:flagellar export protein FliJ n=1 Tax=Salinisphaera sp. SPP-AMP-43 TaxID=3121288 RepID=UPI003C6E7960